MIKAIINGIFSMVIGLVSILLSPIDAMIATVLPDLSNAMTAVGNLFTLIGNGVGWVISMIGLNDTVLALIVAYYTFKLTVPLGLWMTKLAVKWYNAIKP
ncbi:hypothetical protein [Erysipelothrix aquatica]|uniref:hypothetical protein n=1 Tax=Erysipelothrix aquatica TaxID=2683714 RepID=UPI00135AB44A|nr:hypothetical protein [Erysipelothrix aquatica]